VENTDRHGRAEAPQEGLIPKHGGFEKLKTFQLAELIYDVTVRFCDRYVNPRSRTHDQMEQAARSGSRNIAEGSEDSAISKKMEMKLTGIGKASLVELKKDYEAFLRHHALCQWPPSHPALMRFKALRCATLNEFRAWVAEETRRECEAKNQTTQRDTGPHNTDAHGRTRTETDAVRSSSLVRPCGSVAAPSRRLPQDTLRPLAPGDELPATLAANGTLSLLNLCLHLLKRQLEAQAAAFEQEGGFTERLYKRRMERRTRSNG
jgi:four helix bundle suffix protein